MLRLHPTATGKNGGKHNKYVRYIVEFYWVVWNVVMRRSTLRLYRRQASTMDKRERKLSIVNYQLSIDKILHCQLSILNWIGLVLVSVKRRNEVERPERRCLSEASLRRAQRNEETE